jgi:hypothetical protein
MHIHQSHHYGGVVLKYDDSDSEQAGDSASSNNVRKTKHHPGFKTVSSGSRGGSLKSEPGPQITAASSINEGWYHRNGTGKVSVYRRFCRPFCTGRFTRFGVQILLVLAGEEKRGSFVPKSGTGARSARL